MAQSRLQIAKKDILRHFDSLNKRVFKRSEIDAELTQHREFWRLSQAIGRKKFIEFLSEVAGMHEIVFDFPTRKEVRYVWREASDYEIIQSLRPSSYFTHFTAIHLHSLTLQIPKTVYLNYEQPKKQSTDRTLEQDRIDYAFQSKWRTSATVAAFGQRRVCLLNGQFTGQRGVETILDELGNNVMVTDLERTLIDIVVRPVYSGGVHTVLEAYKHAAAKLKVNRLTAMLTSLDYAYPYHQAIGFYMERSGGYTDSQIAIVERFEKKFDFYLDHQIKQKQYSDRWRVYFPKGL
jgi:predicted transcriptional regulator of viral defense system